MKKPEWIKNSVKSTLLIYKKPTLLVIFLVIYLYCLYFYYHAGWSKLSISPTLTASLQGIGSY